mmetsp:Transcript_13211/g.33716  ORF Transcript_13211/g.33716 Transcript_13211/m.33716 type:complete len:117 (+) Transcript_13211:504-854(+)
MRFKSTSSKRFRFFLKKDLVYQCLNLPSLHSTFQLLIKMILFRKQHELAVNSCLQWSVFFFFLRSFLLFYMYTCYILFRVCSGTGSHSRLPFGCSDEVLGLMHKVSVCLWYKKQAS